MPVVLLPNGAKSWDRVTDGEAKFWLTPAVTLANYTGLSPGQLRQAQFVVEAHIKEIEDAWKRHFGG